MSQEETDARRLREAFASLSEDARPTGDCPPPESLWAAARADLSHEEIRRVALHALSCGACAEAWRLAREFGSEIEPRVAPRLEPDTSGSRAWWRSGWGAALSAAALVLLVAGALLVQRESNVRVPPAYRGAPDETIQSLLAGNERLSPAHCILRWSGPVGARYSIKVAAQNLDVVATAENLTEGEYRLPPEALAGMPPGGRLLWQVKAALGDGRQITSRTFTSRLE